MPNTKWMMAALVTCMAVAAFLLAGPGNAQRDNDFYFQNQSGGTITELYVAQGHEDEWGPDRLGNQTLAHGYEVFIAPRRVHCRYDFKVVWDNGFEWEVPRRIDLCEVSRVTVHCNGKTCWVKEE